MSDHDETQSVEEFSPASERVFVAEPDDATSGLYERKIAWAVISAAIVIYLIAFPIRVLYYRYDFIEMKLYRIRPWVPVREIWFEQVKDLPDFGSKLGVQIVFVACLLAIVAVVIYGLWIVLVQAEAEQPADRADAA